MNYFDGIKVGDRVWYLRFGWGTVTLLGTHEFPIFVAFDTGVDGVFTIDGREDYDDVCQSLFWDVPTIIAPPRPKRKVEKTVSVWCVMNNGEHLGHGSYTAKEPAERYARKLFPRNAVVVELTGTYTVEE